MEQIQLANYRKLCDFVSDGDAKRLQQLARRYHKGAETLCNGLADYRGRWDENGTKRLEKLQDRREAAAAAIAKAHGLGLYVQRDPRGWPFYLYDLQNERLLAFQTERGYTSLAAIDSIYNSIGVAVCPDCPLKDGE